MKPIQILSTLFLIYFKTITVETYTNGDCFNEKTQSAGNCINLNNCESALKNIHNRNSPYYPQICRFENVSPYVCCPAKKEEVKVETRKKAEEMCKEYSERLLNVVKDTKNRQIIEGEDADEGEFPHMATIGYGEEYAWDWACGGSLISERFVLTAAHCRSHPVLGQAKVVQLGDNSLTKPSTTRKLYKISKLHIPETYKAPFLYDDIALIELTSSVQFSPYIKPACLQTNPDISSFQKYKTVVTGWGITEADSDQISEVLQKVELEYFSNCQSLYKPHRKLPQGINNDKQLCFGSRIDRKDACKGDSGGPIQFFDFGLYLHRIIGVVSAGKSCGTIGSPGLYTKISNYIEWIENIVW